MAWTPMTAELAREIRAVVNVRWPSDAGAVLWPEFAVTSKRSASTVGIAWTGGPSEDETRARLSPLLSSNLAAGIDVSFLRVPAPEAAGAR